MTGIDSLRIEVLPDRAALGTTAAAAIGSALVELLDRQESVRVVFAAAPSQAETLAALAADERVDWSRIDAFHMDEYVGIDAASPQRFGNWLRNALFDRLPLRSVALLDPQADPDAEVVRYANLLEKAPIDVVLAGIGVTGHLAFNDPPVDLDEPASMKVVTLHEASRVQQVDEGLFARLDDVPEQALTVTVTRLLTAGRIFAMVPGAAKREAVRRSLFDPIGPDNPAGALRRHPAAALYLDADSSPYE